jgi:hypothetical protein
MARRASKPVVIRLRHMLVLAVALANAGCAADMIVTRPPPEGYDVVVIPGCPSDEGGKVSLCQLSRALWATILWQRGTVRHFITSGAAVHSPYVEAEAMAAAMAAAGVPADRIYLERYALHTDENMYDSLRIAWALGFRTMAVASNSGHAAWGCKMMGDYGQRCAALPLDLDAVKALHARLGARVDGLSTPRVETWRPLEEVETQRAKEHGRPKRLPSFLLYGYLWIKHMDGQIHIPDSPEKTPTITWADREKEIAGAPLRK